MEKKCRECGQVKDVRDLVKNKSHKDGVENWCKDCKNSYNKKKNYIYIYNHNHNKIYRKEWYQKNKKTIQAATKKWRKAHPERVASYDKRWRLENPERAAEISKRNIAKSKERHPEHYKARQALHDEINAGRIQKANNFICSNCKVKQAEQYHHHKGYAKEYWLDVIPLCIKCHKLADRRI